MNRREIIKQNMKYLYINVFQLYRKSADDYVSTVLIINLIRSFISNDLSLFVLFVLFVDF